MLFFVMIPLIMVYLSLNVVLCEGIELVQWGELGTISSHVGIKFTAAERGLWVIANVPPYLLNIVVGLTLGDGCLRVTKRGVNALLLFDQSIRNSAYFWYVYFLLGPIISAFSNFRVGSRNGVPFYLLRLWTPALPFLTELRDLFYPQGIKCIPASEIIYWLLSPVALAFWIQDDALWDHSGLVICTDSYTVPDTVRLMNVLMIRYRLNCTLRMYQGKPRIYIFAKSIPLLRSIVMPYICPSMLYKLGL